MVQLVKVGGMMGGRRGGAAASPWEKPLYPNFPQTLIGRFERSADILTSGTSGATIGDVAVDPNNPPGDQPYGSTEFQVTQASSGTNTHIFSPSGTVSPVDVRNSNIILSWRGVANMAVILANYIVRVDIFSAGTPQTAGSNFHSCSFQNWFTSQNRVTSQRQQIGIPINRFSVNGSGADLSAITWSRWIVKRNASSAITYCPGNIYSQPNPRIADKTPILLRFDGCHKSAFDVAYQALMSEFGTAPAWIVPGRTADAPVSGDPTLMDWDDIATWISDGGEFGSHSWEDNGNDALGTEAFYTEDITAGRQGLYERMNDPTFISLSGGANLDHMASGGSYYNNVGYACQNFIRAVRRSRGYHFMQNFQTASSADPPIPLGGECFPPADRWNNQAVSGNSWADPATYATLHITNAIANHGMATFVFHDEIANPGQGLDCFNTVVQYVADHPNDCYFTTPAVLFDPYVTLYGGVT